LVVISILKERSPVAFRFLKNFILCFLVQEITAAEILRCLRASLYPKGKKKFACDFIGPKRATVL